MTELTLDVYTSPMRDISTGGQFSPTTSTLLTGPTERCSSTPSTWKAMSPNWPGASNHPGGH